ncbi:MAG: HAD family hydrolase [candidate division Zixibacteria bacterium]|nr:HAD family hydrolase [candidate division Zixibacteria bacterium]
MKTPEKSKIKGVIFDLGSTLIEYENIPWDEMNLLALEAGYNYLKGSISPLPSYDKITEEYLKIRDKNRESSRRTLQEWNVLDKIAELLKVVCIDSNNEIISKFFKFYYNVISNQLTIIDDAKSVLGELKNAGLKLGLVSNTIFPAKYHMADMERFGLIKYFDSLLFSSEFGYRKPHRLIYEKAVEQSGLKPEQLIFIGDRFIEDFEGPRENGIFSILKFREGREYPEPFPDDIVMIKSLNELPEICLK